MSREEAEDLIAALLELRGQMRKLQWYGEVRRRGFIKTTKKLDKKIPCAQSQKKYIDLKVDLAAFATNTDLVDAVTKINEWLPLLNEMASREDDAASLSSLTLNRVTSRPTMQVAPDHIAYIEQSIREDNVVNLTQALEEPKSSTSGPNDSAFQQFLKNLLQRSIFCRSRKVIAALLEQIVFLDDQDDINKRNCIHRLVIAIGRSQTSKDNEAATEATYDGQLEVNQHMLHVISPVILAERHVVKDTHHPKILGREDKPVALLQYLLDQ